MKLCIRTEEGILNQIPSSCKGLHDYMSAEYEL